MRRFRTHATPVRSVFKRFRSDPDCLSEYPFPVCAQDDGTGRMKENWEIEWRGKMKEEEFGR